VAAGVTLMLKTLDVLWMPLTNTVASVQPGWVSRPADVNEFVDQFVVGKNKVYPPSTLRNGTRRAKSAWRGKELSSNCAARLSISQ